MSTPRKPAQPIEPEWEPAPSNSARPKAPAAPNPPRRADKTVVSSEVQALALRNSEASAFLLVCMGPNVGHRYPLFERILLGRSENADITLADDRVSGKHCEVVRSGTVFLIRDLGSSNGTLVNAQKVTESELREGDLVQVGYTVFKFQSAAGARVERVADPQVLGPGGMGMQGMMPGMGMGGMPGMGMGGMPGMGMSGMPTMGMGMPGVGMGMGMGGMPGMQAGMQPMQPGMGMGGMGVMPTTQSGAPEPEMNLEEMVGNVRKIVDIFLPHAKLIAACTIVGLLGGIVFAVASPPGAKATFEMNILTGADSSQNGGVANDRATAAKSNFKSTVLLRRTLVTLGQGEETSDDRIAVLLKNLNFESTTPNFGMPPPVQNFVGDFTASTEENALLFLDTHVKTFIDSEVEKTTNVLSSKLKYLTEQIAKAEGTLRASDEELKEFKMKYLASLPENVAKLQEQIFELEKNKTELSSTIEQLKLEIVGAQSSGGGASRKAKLIKQIQDEIADLKAQGLGENHPDVLAVKKRLARTEAAPEDTGGSGRSGDKSLSQLKAEVAAKQLNLTDVVGKLEEAKKQQETLPEFSARYADLTRSYDSSKKLYDQLFQERNGAEYQLGFERTAAEGRFEIVVPPRVEKQSAVKAYAKKIVIGVVGGIALGIAVAVFLQILKIWRRT